MCYKSIEDLRAQEVVVFPDTPPPSPSRSVSDHTYSTFPRPEEIVPIPRIPRIVDVLLRQVSPASQETGSSTRRIILRPLAPGETVIAIHLDGTIIVDGNNNVVIENLPN